ncbi:MAG: MBL fold metallo-hydrolase [Acidobacteria bacterium]|nr:MBL fold metallo-hydrolase [Acidobacteriota bacterium]
MLRTLAVLVAVCALAAAPAGAQDVEAVLQAAAEAMGDPESLSSIEYSGTGWVANVGQSFTPAEDWPRFEVSSYSRTIDYDARSSVETHTRRQGDFPARGGGAPLVGEQTRTLLTSGDHSWMRIGDNDVPRPQDAEVRQLDIWLSPHGFLKAAAAADDASAVELMLEGRPLTIVTFTAMGRYRVNGTINEDNLVERALTWVPHPVLGDMIYDHRYTGYQDFDGVMFPTVLHSHQGDPSVHPGHNSMEITVGEFSVNVEPAAVEVPDAVAAAEVPPVVVRSTQMASGVWRVSGGTHHSVAVEFNDFIAVVEAPQNEARSLGVIAELRRRVPDKPIRYVVNTHHHADHAGGLRTYVAQSATVLTHEANGDFYRNVFFHPGTRSLEPDILSSRMPWFAPNRVPAIELVSDSYTLTDGEREMHIYAVEDLSHTGTMLIAHLPAERILINADLYSPPRPDVDPPAANANMRALAANIERLGLDIARHVGVHGLVGSHVDFLRIVNAE